MTVSLILHTSSTSTSVTGDCCVFWQNAPKLALTSSQTKLIDATPLSLEEVWAAVFQYPSVTLSGIDVLLPLRSVSVYQILSFIRGLSDDKTVTVILNSDDSLRSEQGDHEILLKSLAHSAISITALRALPSGRDKEFAGMFRRTQGYNRQAGGVKEGERLYRYRENMMTAIP